MIAGYLLNTESAPATRSWTDSNNDGIPQVAELGPLSNTSFGQVSIATRYDPDTIHGFDHRRNNWEVSATVSHELASRVSAEVSYFRRAQGHFTTTDNLDVAPGDFTPYCVTAPKDSRLPDGGGYQVCGLYDITPTKFGLVSVSPRFDLVEPTSVIVASLEPSASLSTDRRAVTGTATTTRSASSTSSAVITVRSTAPRSPPPATRYPA